LLDVEEEEVTEGMVFVLLEATLNDGVNRRVLCFVLDFIFLI